ncbi:MAG TPA: Ger(x)C family spore germination C-terminal domain-containing protein [Candidatus Gallimonas gallistercoris]|uniref:Ger(X)C family spore germination C-terminal domain-containing protein n=1 Tax=Candidatus Gallimonas gallistercoris TaxID=2838602 RepID=A0A9D2H1E9_9FIRM|nr:Ger(x)C family spore germination C-terminal domain-containing protein [Candidatus Gallimonas gallistercoris]
MKRILKRTAPKFALFLGGALLFAFFSNDFGLVDIQKTAVILAAGIDKSGEGYELTAQISVPKGGKKAGGTASVELSGKGETVADCLMMMYADSGWIPKFDFCSLVLLGEEAAREGAMPALNYFLHNEYMSDNCAVAVAEGSAGEMLKKTSAIDDTPSLAIHKLFSGAAEKTGAAVKNTLRVFAVDTLGVSKSSFMPFIRSLPRESGEGGAKQSGSEGSGGEGGAEGSGGKGGAIGSEGSGGEGDTPVLFRAEETALFREGKMTGLLSAEETLAFNLVRGKVKAGILTVKGEDGEPVSLSIKRGGGSAKLGEEDELRAKLSVRLKVLVSDRTEEDFMAGTETNVATDEDERRAEELISSHIASLWGKCQISGCDLLLLARELYRKDPKAYEANVGLIPSGMGADIEVSVKGAD